MIEWYACEFPEKPTDPYVRWHYGTGCTGCRIKLDAVCKLNPDLELDWLVNLVATGDSRRSA
jgi:hypothetical protein